MGVPARASSMSVVLTPPPPTPPRKGEESSARQFYPRITGADGRAHEHVPVTERRPLPLAGRARVGVPARASSMSVALTPPPPTPPRKGEESSARQSYPPDSDARACPLRHVPVIPRCPLPLAGRARVGVPARASSMSVALTPPPPTPPRKGEESSARQLPRIPELMRCPRQLRHPARCPLPLAGRARVGVPARVHR